MKHSLFVIVLAVNAAFCSAATAQELDTPRYDGKWTLRLLEEGAGKRLAANVDIAEFAGTWMDIGGLTMTKSKACLGKRFPITVQASLSTQLAFTAWGSAVAPACPDLTVELRPLDAKTLEGTVRAQGRERTVRLARR